MKTRLPQSSRSAVQREPAATTPSGRASAGAASERVDASTRQAAQRRRLDASFGEPAQRAAEEEELQMKQDPAALQRAAEEDEMQMKAAADPVQRAGVEEELPIQGRFPTAQRAGLEEELPAQGRFTAAQRAGLEEEEPLQGRWSGAPAQRKPDPNRTGMPDNLKAGIESLSGMDMSDVRVHAGSGEPQRLNAHAFAQGNDIHVAPGQEKHLPHEAWHVVQQRQGRVKPTMQMEGMPVNDDASLESEADAMGQRALKG